MTGETISTYTGNPQELVDRFRRANPAIEDAAVRLVTGQGVAEVVTVADFITEGVPEHLKSGLT